MTRFIPKAEKYIQSAKYNLWVNRNGDRVYREYNDSYMNRFSHIYSRPDGSKYLNTQIPGIIELDELVADCYVPEPQDGRKYILIHKDGNNANCSADNLEWKEERRFSPTDTIREVIKDIWVRFDGTVWREKSAKNQITIVKDIGDSDTDRIVPISEPYISYRVKNRYDRYDDRYIPMDKFIRMEITSTSARRIWSGWKRTVRNIRTICKKRKRTWREGLSN